MSETIKPISIYLAGDSTVANCPKHEAPMAGWGQVFQQFFTNELTVHNEAKGGRSSNSFIEEGRLTKILDSIQEGDYLFVQFGHNDQKSYGTEPFTTYQSCLQQYIFGAREKGATPILLTSVHRRKFDENGFVVNTLGEYPIAMKQVAKNLDVTLIDLWKKTKVLYETLGVEESKSLFTIFPPDVEENYPDGIEDNTHFCEKGAFEVAKLVIEALREQNIPLIKYIKE
ncbi:rhamnogalacturonan acetylesterase [Metabacillus malikii]|nr:rhamnogalacturonan acetylesterase [Metabacillus malikii]